MRAANRESIRAAAAAAESWVLHKVEDLGVFLLHFTAERGVQHYTCSRIEAPQAVRAQDALPRPQARAGNGEVEVEEPKERKPRHPRGERHMPASRRGA